MSSKITMNKDSMISEVSEGNVKSTIKCDGNVELKVSDKGTCNCGGNFVLLYAKTDLNMKVVCEKCGLPFKYDYREVMTFRDLAEIIAMTQAGFGAFVNSIKFNVDGVGEFGYSEFCTLIKGDVEHSYDEVVVFNGKYLHRDYKYENKFGDGGVVTLKALD